MQVFIVGPESESLGVVATSQETESESVRSSQSESESWPGQHHYDSEILARFRN